MTEQTEQRIECDGRLVARKTARGVKVWCDKHKHEKLLTWEELGVQPIPTARIDSGAHTTIPPTSVLY